MPDPDPDQFLVMGVVVGTVVAFGALMLYRSVLGTDLLILADWRALVAVPMTIGLHELTHAAALPGGLMSRRVVFGFAIRRVLPYVAYDGPLSRDRLLTAALAPFVLWTAVALVVPGWWDVSWVVAGMVTNAGIAGGDLVYSTRLWRGVPNGAEVCVVGWDTYWSTGE